MPRSLSPLWICAIMIVAGALAGCGREHRALRGKPPPPPAGNPYANNAWAISEGAQLYRSFNCAGCHAAHGGGGIGPALMDNKWIYGREPAQIFDTIANGRLNGMPAFRNRLTDQQIWQLVNHVLTMAGEVRFDVKSGRHDDINPGAGPTPPPPENAAKRGGKEP
jgi:cytochrome c oxidase cbb3-type subunit 3